jgi:CRP/FNR family cyclic AMP-dependent transcriptional regulator
MLIAGWVSAVLVFSSFFMRTMIPLRMVAICSNVAFIAYALLGVHEGVFGRVMPILALHTALLPLNVVRLRQLQDLLHAVQECNAHDTIRSLVPYMDTETHTAGDVLFRKGDPADRLFVVERGRVRFPEIGKVVSGGEVFGEVGVFAPENVRTLSAVCEDDCRLHTITGEKALELSYQNPRFGLFLIRLVAGLVVENQGLARSTLTPTA